MVRHTLFDNRQLGVCFLVWFASSSLAATVVRAEDSDRPNIISIVTDDQGRWTLGAYGNRSHYSIHWEFDYDTFWFDRLCPLSYFDDDSRRRIERIWDRSTWMYKDRFPDICSGYYLGRDR